MKSSELKWQLEIWGRVNAMLLIIATFLALFNHNIWPLQWAGMSMMLLCLFLYLNSKRSIDLGYANSVTLLRIFALLLCALWWRMDSAWFAIPILIFLCLDGVDGWLARSRLEASDFGARFDMESDALAVLFLCVGLYLYREVAVWILWTGCIRYLFVGVRAYLVPECIPERRSQWGRRIYVGLMLAIVLGFISASTWVDAALIFMTLAVTGSFILDVGHILYWTQKSFEPRDDTLVQSPKINTIKGMCYDD